jgi:hypothetical protein
MRSPHDRIRAFYLRKQSHCKFEGLLCPALCGRKIEKAERIEKARKKKMKAAAEMTAEAEQQQERPRPKITEAAKRGIVHLVQAKRLPPSSSVPQSLCERARRGCTVILQNCDPTFCEGWDAAILELLKGEQPM